mmetsp:Transcript_2538/g.4462  ORF Transcript_2538/g.4462 Transcript_2538/m.4462 type:complete len:176 (-) Transcript_2538:1561-2088(-)
METSKVEDPKKQGLAVASESETKDASTTTTPAVTTATGTVTDTAVESKKSADGEKVVDKKVDEEKKVMKEEPKSTTSTSKEAPKSATQVTAKVEDSTAVEAPAVEDKEIPKTSSTASTKEKVIYSLTHYVAPVVGGVAVLMVLLKIVSSCKSTEYRELSEGSDEKESDSEESTSG